MDAAFLKKAYELKKERIRERLEEFKEVGGKASDERLFEELCFCVLTANTSARMGLKCIAKVKPKLRTATQEVLAQELTGIYRFPNKRSEYIAANRAYLEREHNFELRKLMESFKDVNELREFLANNVKGFGYKEASHFLRNVGYKDLAILDKHILNSMAELGITKEAKSPRNREEYLEMEAKLRKFSEESNIGIDELDLLLWSLKTGEILK